MSLNSRATALLTVALTSLLLVACGPPEDRSAALYAKAEKLFEAGEFQAARLEAQNALQVEPKNVPARYLLARIAEQNGEFNQMVGHLDVVMREDPQHVPSRVQLGTLLLFAQDNDGARELHRQAAELAPNDPQVLLLGARLQFKDGLLPEGIATLDTVLEQDPTNLESAVLRGLARSVFSPADGLDDLSASIQRFDRSKALPLRQARIDVLSRLKRPEDVEAELRALVTDYPEQGFARDLANFLVAQNRASEAADALEASISQNPEDFELRFALAQLQSRIEGRPEVAEETLRRFISDAPNELRLPILLGTFYEASNREPEAIAQYQTVVKAAPRSEQGLEARARLATLAAAAGRAEEARAGYDAILSDAPDNARALTGRAGINYAEGRYDEAISDLRGALRRSPEDEAALLLMARTHGQLGNASLAEDAYRQLLRINPAHPEGQPELAASLAARGQPDDAIRIYREMLEREADNPVALSGLVAALLARGDLPAAETEARRLVALDDPQGIGQVQLAQVLQSRGDLAGAEAAYRRAFARNPGSRVAFEGVVGTLTSRNQLAEAGAFIDEFLADNPGDSIAELLKAANLLRRDQRDEANRLLVGLTGRQPGFIRAWIVRAGAQPDAATTIKVLQTGLASNPASIDLLMLLANAYEADGRFDEAIAQYETALENAPGLNVAANNAAALLLDRKGDAASVERALALTQRFATSRNPVFLDTLGWANYHKGDTASAVRYLELALANGGDNPVVRYHLGMAYLAAGNPVDARRELEQAIRTGGDALPYADDARAALAGIAG